MNEIELNSILFYADFLSLLHESIPVTDNCKYFFIHNIPINSAYIADTWPTFDIDNKYFKEAYDQYVAIRDKFDEDGVISFIANIAGIGASGCVDAIRMLKCIHQYGSKQERKTALNTYYTWKNSQKYTHIIKDEDGRDKEVECSKYVYKRERVLQEQGLLKCVSIAAEETKRVE